ncbi:caspase family protein [Kitasatospora sp. NPDC057692]|uniref:caspase family protein n=1 Tax=Kitasatospora sp. NPDC057692 TaxID=3346215 RepID=UPI0036C38DFD
MTTSDGPEDGPRRFLIAVAVADYPNHREWNRPGLVRAREKVVDLFTGQLGYRLHDPFPSNPTKQQLTDSLRAFCSSSERRADDLLAVYLSCHGEVLDDGGEHVLLTADTDPEDLTYTALPTAELTRAMLRGTRVQRVMLLLDACYVGQGGNQMAAAALERLGPTWGRSSGSGLVIISSAQPHQTATAGLFPKLLKNAVTALSVAGYGPHTLSVNAVVQHINDSKDLPGHQRIGLAMVGMDGEPPAFFPNPRYSTQLNEIDLALQQAAAFTEQDRKRETEFTSRLLIRAMGYQGAHDDSTDPAWWFSGRHAALHDLAAWLNTAAGASMSACRVVTGAPGSGKTAVLGLVAALTHPERHRTVPGDSIGLPADLFAPGAVETSIYAQGLTDKDVLDALCAAARVPATTVGGLLESLNHRPKPLTVLIDALDEAVTPDTLCITILLPLIEHSQGRIRLLLGARPYLLPRLGTGPEDTIDLDDHRYADPQALTTYTVRTLLQAHRTSPYRDQPHAARPVAKAVADAAGHSFLIARITAGALAAASTIPDPNDPTWRNSLPHHASTAMHHDLHQRLGNDAQRAIDLLRPLAYAQGQGLPWEDVWAPLASHISGRTYTDDDLLWLRRKAGSYVVEATESGRSAYRLYHEAMAEYLRAGTDPEEVHAAYTQVLTDRIPYRADATRDWSRAHPYTLGHLAHHAARAGLLDKVLADSEYLVHVAPGALTPHLHHVNADTARLTAAVYRNSLHLHSHTTPQDRRQVLALTAARAGASDLHQRLIGRIPPGDWAPLWATGSTFDAAMRDILSRDSISAVACSVLDGRPVAVSVHRYGGTVQVWDVGTGRAIGKPLAGRFGRGVAVACTVIDGRPVAVVGTQEVGRVRVWDLGTGRVINELHTGHDVYAVACTAIDGRPVAVTGGREALQAWDLASGQMMCTSPTDYAGVDTVACTVIDGRPAAVSGGWNGMVRVWDLGAGQMISEHTGHRGTVTGVACTVLDGVSVAITGGGGKNGWGLRVWDLTPSPKVGEPVAGHQGRVFDVACTVIGGRPAAVSSGWDGTLGVWDLGTGQMINRFPIRQKGPIYMVACTVLDDRPVALTVEDEAIRLWDLRTGRRARSLTTRRGGSSRPGAVTVLEGRTVALIVKSEAIRLWDLRTGRSTLRPLTEQAGYPIATACTVLDGSPVVLTGYMDGKVRVWDLDTGRMIGRPLTSGGGDVGSIACTVLDGTPIALISGADGTVRMWDLRTGQRTGRLVGPSLRENDSKVEIACMTVNDTPIAIIANGNRNNSVTTWDLRTRSAISSITLDEPFAVALTNTGGLAVGFYNDIAFYHRQPTR